MVAWEAAVTVRAIKPRSALAAAGFITAFRQGPRRAAATHCRVGCITGDPDRSRFTLRHPNHLFPHGGTSLTLTEREVEVANGTAVTSVPLKACAAYALA